MKKRLDITVVVPVASVKQAKKAGLVTIRDGNEFRYWTWKSIVDEKEKFDFDFIKSPADLNLPQSLNSIADKIKTKYVAFLHHDLWLLENGHWLEKAVKYMDSLPNVGVCGIVGKTFEKQETPMIRRYKDTDGKEYTETQGDGAGWIVGYCMVSAMGKGETLIRNYRRKGFFRFPVGKGRWYSNVNIFGRYFEEPTKVQTLDCVVMIVKTEIFKKLLFDEKFPYRCDCMCEDFCIAVNYYFGLQNYVLPLATWHKPCWKRPSDYQEQFRNPQHYIQVKALGKKWKNKVSCILSTSFWTGSKIDDDVFLDWYAKQWKETKRNIRVPARFRTFPEDNKKYVLLVEDLKNRLQKQKPFTHPHRPYAPLELLRRGNWKAFRNIPFPDDEVDWNNDPIRPTSDVKPTIEVVKVENKFYENINFILCINNRVIGFVNTIYDKMYNPFKIWRMGWIVVKPEFRGLGFGVFLMKKLLDYFKYRRVCTTVHKHLVKWYESKFEGRWYVIGKNIDYDGYVVNNSYALMTKPEYREGTKKTSIRRNIVTAFVLMNRRSGTSMTMGLLKILGADIGKNIKPVDELNESGYFEDKNWLRLQMEIATKVRKWKLSQQVIATLPQAVDNGIKRKANEIRLNWKEDFCALKVVSTSFKYIYPLFENVRCILPIRMPFSSFKSVARYWSRKNLRIPRMIDHWKYSASESYLNLNACSINDVPLLILDYDWVLQNPKLAVTKIISFLDIEVSRKIKQKAINFIQKRLKHY